MKVLILSTYEHTGGAAIAAERLLQALQRNGVEAKMLCRRNLSWWKGKPQSWTSIIERAVIWAANGFSKRDLWATDTALFGQDITRTKEYQGLTSFICIGSIRDLSRWTPLKKS